SAGQTGGNGRCDRFPLLGAGPLCDGHIDSHRWGAAPIGLVVILWLSCRAHGVATQVAEIYLRTVFMLCKGVRTASRGSEGLSWGNWMSLMNGHGACNAITVEMRDHG